MSRRKPMSEINVVPYIDVMLVLLVIFMATAPLLTHSCAALRFKVYRKYAKPRHRTYDA